VNPDANKINKFEIQNFACLDSSTIYRVACDSGDPGFVKVVGKTIFVD
jgi:hypothetical protein